MAKVRAAQGVTVSDVWQSKSNAERKAWLKKAGCATDLDTTTFESLSADVQVALEAAK
jgi:hypothetical protein